MPKIGVPVSNLILDEKSILQIYFASSNVITNIISGTFYETQVTQATEDDGLLQSMGFFKDDEFCYVLGDNNTLDAPVAGLYTKESF